MNFLARIFTPSAAKSAEGQWHPPPYQLADGWLPTAAGTLWNWWQCGYDLQPSATSAIVEACISAYSQTVAMCAGTHWHVGTDGGRERVATSALSRILRRPNTYSTISDFMLNLTHSLYQDGNAYALALRNDRFEIDSLHLMDSRLSFPRIATNGELFYTLGGNEIIDQTLDDDAALAAVPARDVLHVKLKTRGGRGGRSGGQLVGVSPMVAAALDEAATNAMAQQAIRFFLNASRPSGALVSPDKLTAAQMDDLRRRWEERSTGAQTGGVVVLSHGVKWEPMGGTSKDSQLAELMGYSDKRIAAVYRVPLPLLNLGNEGPQGSTESLMNFWIGTGLGFALNHIEEAFGKTFGLAGLPTDYLEFDTAALLRSLFKDRVDAFARSVQAGIHAPNDARREFELPDVEDGDDPRVQQQMVPLGFGADLEPPTPGAPGGNGQAEPPADDEGDSQDDNARDLADLVTAAIDRYDTARP